MNSTLYLTAQIGFVILSLVYINYIVTYFPVSWLPGFLVPLAYYLHFLSLKQLIQKTINITQARPLNTVSAQK